MPNFRLAITLPGAASLGSFEGGAMAAILTAVQAMQRLAIDRQEEPPVIIDAFAGASAGAITGLIGARALTAALDPVALLWKAWVEEAGLAKLRCRNLHSPLSLDGMAVTVDDLLDREGRTRLAGVGPQAAPIHLGITLCCLHGLKYELADLNRDAVVPALSFRDWSEFTFTPEAEVGQLEQFTEPTFASALEVAVASAANPLAFAPRLLNRRIREEDCEAILENRVAVPPDGWLWYSDGGIGNNEPLGQAIRMANNLDDDIDARTGHCHRVHVVVHPAPNYDSSRLYQVDNSTWTAPLRRPKWADTLVHAGRIALSQSTYDDLRNLVRDNKRIRWKEQLLEALEGTLTEEQVRRLSAVSETIERDRRAVRRLRAGDTREVLTEPSTQDGRGGQAEPDLRRVIDAISGLRGRERVHVAVIAPARNGRELHR